MNSMCEHDILPAVPEGGTQSWVLRWCCPFNAAIHCLRYVVVWNLAVTPQLMLGPQKTRTSTRAFSPQTPKQPAPRHCSGAAARGVDYRSRVAARPLASVVRAGAVASITRSHPTSSICFRSHFLCFEEGRFCSDPSARLLVLTRHLFLNNGGSW